MDGFNYKEINYNQSNFIGYINQGKIFNQFHQQVGVVLDEHKKAIDVAKGFQDKAEEYRNKLIEAGIITKPKTPEEINQELQNTIKQQQEALATMMQAISEMGDKISKLEVNDVRQSNSTVNIRNDVKGDEASDGTKAKTSVRSGK